MPKGFLFDLHSFRDHSKILGLLTAKANGYFPNFHSYLIKQLNDYILISKVRKRKRTQSTTGPRGFCCVDEGKFDELIKSAEWLNTHRPPVYDCTETHKTTEEKSQRVKIIRGKNYIKLLLFLANICRERLNPPVI